MDDRVLVYRGADQPDMSVINPEADVWQHVKVCINALTACGITEEVRRYPRLTWRLTGPYDTPP